MEAVRTLLLALLALLPRSTGTRLVQARFDAIAQTAEQASAEHGVPVGLLLAIGWSESWLGTHPRSGGSWGNPIDRHHRSVAGRPSGAAHILARGRRLCGSWFGAVSFFRSGRCRAPRLIGYKPEDAIRLARRIYTQAGIDVPSDL